MPDPNQDSVVADNVVLSDVDPFGILTDDNPNHLTPSGDGTPNDSPAPDGTSPDGKTFPDGKYWQSQTDLAKQENDRLRKELEELKTQVGPYIPIVQSLDKNPQITATLVKAMQEQRVAAEAAKVLMKPEPPQKPAQFDPHDAVTNPESPSFKYREALETYQMNLMGYLEKKEAERESRVNEMIAQRQQEETMKKQLTIMRMELTKAGFKPEEQAEFLQFFSKPDNLNMSDLIALYKLRKSTKATPGSPGSPRAPGLPTGGSSEQNDVIDPKNTGQVFSAGLKALAR